MAEKKAPEESGSKKKTYLIIAVISLVVLLAAGVGTYLYLDRSESGDNPAREAGRGGGAIGPMVNIEPFVINIRDDRDARYLKAAMTLEVDSPRTVTEVIGRMPQLRDAILLLVGNKSYDELRDLQGKLQLRTELAVRLNELLQTGQVKRIYFTDFVVQ